MKKGLVMGTIGLVMGVIVSYVYCRKRFEEGYYEDEKNNLEVDDHYDHVVHRKNDETYMDEARGNDQYKNEEMESEIEIDNKYKKVVKGLYKKDFDDKPFVITELEFGNENHDYEKLTLLYYDNGIITDENDDIIEKPLEVIGEDTLAYFGYGSDDKDLLYVRNNILRIDYEILRQNTNYQPND